MCGLCLDSVLMLGNASLVTLTVRSSKVGFGQLPGEGFPGIQAKKLDEVIASSIVFAM
jgi:hypothetical protein